MEYLKLMYEHPVVTIFFAAVAGGFIIQLIYVLRGKKPPK